MFDPSPSANPTPLTHADTSRDVLPRGGTSHAGIILLKNKARVLQSNGRKTVLRMPSTYQCAVSVPLRTAKGVRLQKKWHPRSLLLVEGLCGVQ
ncbi:hypothetical protein TNCV_3752531 [Trichonephila clavipes]|nr:hypothetical protein TNCV_3752531 [Trichonephila clavipes]